MRAQFFIIFLFITYATTTCTFQKKGQLFQLRKASKTGLKFNNQITISDSLNAITFEYIYNGGGAAVGDVNNDGNKDLFFAGNMVTSRLYLNIGNLEFEDITEPSGVTTNSWCTGISLVDINNDELLDIYISVAGLVESELRRNIFFINQGIDENGIPHFINKAEEMGLDDDGYSTMAAFFDYDKDHDLDMYLLTNSMEGNQRNMIKPISIRGESETTDRFYLNKGDDTFTNYSLEAGIQKEGFGLGIALCDINQDSWVDVYCANDFISSDLLWINNQDGTFTERAGEYFKHFTSNGMGMDIADYNNDALLDIVVLDMMPASNLRQKLMFAFRNMDRLHESIEMGYLPQFMRNTLQLNMGKGADGKYRFSEISFLAGMHQTDWSWAPLLMDFDNDGWKDLLITNGYRKDVTNLDYISDIIRETKFGDNKENRLYLINAIYELEDVKLPNHIFKNNTDLTFEDKSEEWGLSIPTFSNGTVTCDFDNDGDLDIVVNNIDEEVHLYENLLNEKNNINGHFLTLNFDQKIKESEKIGSKIWIFQKQNKQFFEYSSYRGYKSTVDPAIHIGLGNNEQVDSLIVQWPDGTVQKTIDVKCDTIHIISRSNLAKFNEGNYIENFIDHYEDIEFKEISKTLELVEKHHETHFNDFKRTPSLIRSLSRYGPSLTVGDINQDGLDEVIMGGDRNKNTIIFMQQSNHTFSKSDLLIDSLYEDMGSLLFDADGDLDLDLYLVSGGSFWKENDPMYQDRLYINDGTGQFQYDSTALPQISSSGSCVVAGDYDRDGDLDLFVGGRLVPNKYPSTPKSYLLENVDGKFTNRSGKLGNTQGLLGMVTSALWTDVNNDDKLDLMITGEWMRITVLINTDTSFVDQSDFYKLTNTAGWWNSINGGDFDNDGDIDYLVGNYGLNSWYKATVKEPLEIHAKDFDRNGTFDPVITNYIDGKSYIVHTRNTINQLIPSMANRFMTYESYGSAPFNKSFTTQELEGAIHLTCQMMQSIILENVDGIAFIIHNLPLEAQFSPIFGTILEDFNNDNRLDVMIVGNSMADESVAGYYDASYGSILINKGDFNWNTPSPSNTNFIADGDKKALTRITLDQKSAYLVSENDGYLQAFSEHSNQADRIIKLNNQDWYYFINYNGSKRKVELYYGSGYLSSSSRNISLALDLNQLSITNFQGIPRSIYFIE